MSTMESGLAVEAPPTALPKAFYFNTSAHLLRIGRERATTLAELLQALRTCSEGSIFEHTFRTLQEHHFIRKDSPTILLTGHSQHVMSAGLLSAWPA